MVMKIWFSASIPLACAVIAACDPDFENRTEVIDLRVLAMVAEPPEQILDVDPQNLPAPQDLLLQLRPIDVCGLVGDPVDRPLRWSYTVCVEGVDVRCDDNRPKIALTTAVSQDPESTLPRPAMCTRIQPDVSLLAVLQSAIDADPLSGFSGIDLLVEWKVEAEGAPAVYAGKRVRFAARQPASRVANKNPVVTEFSANVITETGIVTLPLPLGRCIDQAAPITIALGDRVDITPREPDGVREDYVVPTFTGMVREFTETIEYQWYTSLGTFSAAVSGGARDGFGNLPDFNSVFRTRDDATGAGDAAIWIVQRDERLGEAWFESCVRVKAATP
jgi:hypothetical protein